MTRVGTVIFGRSSRKSVVPKAFRQPSSARWSAWASSASACWRWSSVTVSTPSAEKNCVDELVEELLAVCS